eukprot:gene724-4017_t
MASQSSLLPARLAYVAELQEMANSYLTDHSKEMLRQALIHLKRHMSVAQFVTELTLVAEFDRLAPYNKMPHPLSRHDLQKLGKTRTVTIRQASNGGYGMSIRGGHDLGVGIFVSIITEGQAACKAGLLVGDEIISANGIYFDGITHARAVEIIKTAASLKLTVRYTGHVPATTPVAPQTNWVDNLDKPVGTSSTHVVISKQKGTLGFSIRGGSDFGTPVFVSSVDKGGQAESVGLKPGHQILLLNGCSIPQLRHHEVIDLIRNTDQLNMTVQLLQQPPTWLFSTLLFRSRPDASSSSNRASNLKDSHGGIDTPLAEFGTLIRDVKKGSDAWVANIQPGQVLFAIEDIPTATLKHEEICARLRALWRCTDLPGFHLTVSKNPLYTFDSWNPPCLPFGSDDDLVRILRKIT